MPKIIAHRGASSEEPENTISSIMRAIEIGADYIELDVHLSADKVPIVIHDPTFCRTTNAEKGKHVHKTHLHEVKAFDAGAWFKGESTGEKIPTLEEVFELPLGKTGLMIEIKDDPDHDLSRAVMHLVEAHPETHVLIGSFFAKTLRYVMKHYPKQAVIGIVEDRNELLKFEKMKIPHLAIDHVLLLENGHKSAAKIWVFTVDDHEVAKKLVALGVMGIITNHPRALKKFVKENLR